MVAVATSGQLSCICRASRRVYGLLMGECQSAPVLLNVIADARMRLG